MRFGRAPTRLGSSPEPLSGDAALGKSGIAADMKLFATTFAAGFLFVSILIG